MHDSMQATHGGAALAGWGMAARATLHCLTGCAIGEILGMVIGTAAGLHNAATVVLSIALAFVFGYALTMRRLPPPAVRLTQAIKLAPPSATASIRVLEIVDNPVLVPI